MADNKSQEAATAAAPAKKPPIDSVERKLDPVDLIEDELLAATPYAPIVEAIGGSRDFQSGDGYGARGSSRALWFFGAVVSALLILQTTQLFLDREERLAPSSPTAAGEESTATGESHRSPEQEVDRLLYESRIKLNRGVYEDVIRILEPLVADSTLTGKEQRWESYLLLARAHRALGNVERAQSYYLRATDQSIDRQEPALVLEDASDLSASGRFLEARETLFGLLARRDGLPKAAAPFAALAEARVADSWYAQALATGQIAPLPGEPMEASH